MLSPDFPPKNWGNLGNHPLLFSGEKGVRIMHCPEK